MDPGGVAVHGVVDCLGRDAFGSAYHNPTVPLHHDIGGPPAAANDREGKIIDHLPFHVRISSSWRFSASFVSSIAMRSLLSSTSAIPQIISSVLIAARMHRISSG